MSRGGNRPGAGRPKGARGKKVQEQIEAVNGGLTPLQYLVSIYQDQTKEEKDRIDAAKAAAPYIHPKLSQVDMRADVSFSHEDALEELE